jgi:16S rRNA processing protein RimM
LRGEVRVTPLTDDPGRFAELTECVLWDAARDERETRRIAAARRQGAVVVLRLEGCETVDDAAALGGRFVALPREAAAPPPPGRFYPWQLAGCAVTTEDGVTIGRVARIEQGPAHDLWVVEADGREHLVPAVPEIVLDVDLAARRVVIRPPEGLLDL